MLPGTIMCLRRDKRGISNVIVVMLSLVIVVIIFSNVILTSYQMNQFDWDRMKENVEITDVEVATITLHNAGSVTAHVVSLWVDSPTTHQRYDIDLFINVGDSTNLTCDDINASTSIVKVITERGTISVFRGS
jgi:Na+-transporting NADH:ubiquinone oxidoreductase subunit NqrC